MCVCVYNYKNYGNSCGLELIESDIQVKFYYIGIKHFYMSVYFVAL